MNIKKFLTITFLLVSYYKLAQGLMQTVVDVEEMRLLNSGERIIVYKFHRFEV
jgi:hypothetical protein